ncbi:MAG TPA: hypothetical protein VIH16_08990 [Bellilinea sp.]
MTQTYRSVEIRQLIARLERLSVDSAWAHRAAGLRGDLWKALASLEVGDPAPAGLQNLVEQSYRILVRAAKEIPAHD